MKNKRTKALLLFIMKSTVLPLFLILTMVFTTFANSVSGQLVLKKEIQLNIANQTLKEAIGRIQHQTGVSFIYSSSAIQAQRRITFAGNGKTIEQFITEVLAPLQVKTKVIDNKILLFCAAEGAAVQQVRASYNISGVVKNVKGETLQRVTVSLENTAYATMTDASGRYALAGVPEGEYTIVFTYVGYMSYSQKIVVAGGNLAVNAQLSEDLLKLDDVVVTSTGNPQKKIESSVAITSRTSRQLALQAPLNSSDMLKTVPGLSAESSGGDGPGSIRVRGLPGGGYIYLGIMEDGLPVLPTGYSSLPSADQYFKYDLTIKNIEAIRGGNAAIITSNTPGAVINNLSYTGAQNPYGTFKFTSGLSQSLYRVDGNTGGQLNDKWQYNIGGFYRTDKGIKQPDFTANKGGQLKLNLTRKLGRNDQGYLRFYGKYLNDRVQWLLPGYYGYKKGSHLSNALPYFDNFTETLMPDTYQFNVKVPGDQTFNIDLSDGFYTKIAYGGMLFHYKTNNNWTINNNFRYQSSKMTANSSMITAPQAFKSGVNYYYSNGTQLQNPTGYYTAQQISTTQRNDKQVIDYLDFTKKAGVHNITIGAGLYLYDFTSEAATFTTSTEIKDKPSIILVNNASAAPLTPVANTSKSGHTKFDGVSGMYSGYLSDLIKAGAHWTFDAGFRFDYNKLNGHRAVYTGSSVSSGGQGFVIDHLDPYAENFSYWSASLGINYKVNDYTGIFGRATRTYNAFTIDNFSAVDARPSELKKRQIYLGELGVRYAHSKLAFFSSVSYSSVSNFPLTIGVPGAATGSVITQSTFGSSRTYSWETEISYELLKGLNLRGLATIEDAKFTSYDIVVSADADPSIAGKPLSWKGNRPERLPKTNLQLSATYDYKGFNLYANAAAIGSRWSTNANTYRLDGYTEVNAGAGYSFGKKLELRAWVNNLLNARGLTEGNVRGEQFIDVNTLKDGQLMIGRAILPRSLWASISFSF